MIYLLNRLSLHKKTKHKIQYLMDYVHTYPDAYIIFHASDMILNIDSDAAYLVVPKSRSRVACYFYLSSKPKNTDIPKLNVSMHIEYKTLKHVVSSAAKAEVGGIFHNSQVAILIRTILHALNHPQSPTPVKTYNTTSKRFIYYNIHQKRSKSWDIRYYWLRDRQTQHQFCFY